ncbi:MazG nucleotide pyrophosphohydrolase domain-containing protein [Halococcus hamelinensis]|uniref:Nucleotide pyrophosphohydrolase n=1 Tax=Halococcus hamelinensis 100A6 TaxID=1132509 RepID=M0M6J5_9EURY|nr:MazG nucleotide pyrophosphohydrolase domain-containing protein [Halococcus hamelinensis]EMA41437.1 nucleotide pyrophosphohydrolase [Halococcus hamelinensis 100A6]
MEAQRRVAAFVADHDLDAPPEHRILDLAAEVGEIAADATESSNYGADPAGLSVNPDEIGDALFSLLALADSLDIDAGDALDEAFEKYETRIDETGSASSEG